MVDSIGGISGGSGFGAKMDPDAYARQYAQQKGISFEQAKAELKAMYGAPKAPQKPQQ